MPKRITSDDYIKLVKEKHGNKYDLSNTVYKGMKKYITAICPLHGEFIINAYDFAYKRGCPKCGINKRPLKRGKRIINTHKKLTSEIFIEKSKKIFGETYCYDNFDINKKDKKGRICIVCPKHGEFWQNPYSHLNGHGCKKCGKEKIALKQSFDNEFFIKRCKEIHGDKYRYSFTNYKNSHDNIEILCPKHGIFTQKAYVHLQGHGCPKCSNDLTKITLSSNAEEFINKAKQIHGDKYNYDDVIYSTAKTPVIIKCRRGHTFLQMPNKHLLGHGCPFCNDSHMENNIEKFLEEKGIAFEKEKKFDWLKSKNHMRLDFYLPEYNAAIECQGLQHFEEVNFGGGKKTLSEIQERDRVKKKLCEEHGMKVFYYVDYDYDFPYHVYNDKDKLLKTITNNEKTDL